MDNNITSGGNTKQIKRTSSPLVEGGGKGSGKGSGKGRTGERKSERVKNNQLKEKAIKAAEEKARKAAEKKRLEEAVKGAEEAAADQRAKTVLSIVNSFLDPFKKTFS